MTTGTGWVVLKFGGTSVASPRALRRVAAVVARTRREARVAVVVSALAGVTSALEAAATAAARGQVVGAAVAGRLRRRHRVLLHRLAAPLAGETARELEPVLRELRERLDAITAAAPARPEAGEQASLLAIGERLAVNVVAAVLRTRGLAAQPVDARALLVANGDALEAEPDLAASAARTQAWLARSPDVPVVTGFFATNAQDELVLLGRGGSDLSATLLAHALAATRVEIWTDTPGVLTADPRIEPQARVHRTLSPEQANRLARLGARVLHPRTLEPLRLRRIPLLVRDAFHPERAGTRVASDVRTPFATVVTGPLLVRVASDAGVELPRLAAVLRAHDIPALLSPLDDSLLVPTSALASVRATALTGLRFAPGPHGARLVAVAARHSLAPDRVGRALAAAGVFPLAPAASALPGVTAVVVHADDAERATRALHTLTVRAQRPVVDVVVAGARGRVGRALLARLARHARVRPRAGEPLLRLVAAFDTRGFVAEPFGLDPTQVAHLLEHSVPRALAAVLASLGREPDGARAPLVFVDCTASEALAARHTALLTRGIAVVTANKHALAAAPAAYRALREAARRTPLRAATTVGAGLPVLATVRSLRRRGDALVSLRATLSGTLAFVLAAVHSGTPLSRAVAEARALGYTEPNPAADLSGADVARKLVIVLREAGIAVDPRAVRVEPLVPDDVLTAPDAATLFARLEPHDAAFARRAAHAQAHGQRLVYAASYDGHVARAGLVAMAEHDALALARPGENVVRLRTALHDRVPLVLAGPGAGVAITAAGVHGDLLSAARALLRQRGAGHGLARDRRTTVATGARAHPAWA